MTNLCCENEFCLHENKNHLHIKDFAISLALKQRLEATRKRPIKRRTIMILLSLPVPLNHLGTGPLLAPPTRGLLPEEELCSLRDVSGAKDVPGSAVDELTRESPISGLGEARTDNTLQIKKKRRRRFKGYHSRNSAQY